MSENEPDTGNETLSNQLTEHLSKQQKRFLWAVVKSVSAKFENKGEAERESELPPSSLIRSCRLSFDELISWSADENFMSALAALYRVICVLDRFYVHSSLLRECANGNYQAMKVLMESCVKAETAETKAAQNAVQSAAQKALSGTLREAASSNAYAYAYQAAPEADIEDIFSVRGEISEQSDADAAETAV